MMRTRLARFLVGIVVLCVVVGCEETINVGPTPPPDGQGPVINFVRPANGATFSVNERVSVAALAQDSDGVLRVDFIVNGVVEETQPLTFVSQSFEFRTNWTPTAIGQHALSVVAYNVNGVASQAATIAVNVALPTTTLTPVPGTPTVTPIIIVVTSTSTPRLTATQTPRFVVVTPTRTPSTTRTQTPFILVVTATPNP